jgi:hypothetical protein
LSLNSSEYYYADGRTLRVFLIALGISKEELWKGPPPPSDAQQVAKICLVTCPEQGAGTNH